MNTRLLVMCFMAICGQDIMDDQCSYWQDDQCLLHANCSNRGFGFIPALRLPNVVYLDLSTNRIEKIESKSFSSLTNLLELNLTANIISLLEVDAFLGLEHLRILNIRKNFLVYNSISFPNSVFKPLKSLFHLDITSSGVYHSDQNFEEFSIDVISDLKTLESIVIDIISDRFGQSVFGIGFTSLTHLTKLTAGSCNIKFDNATFLNVPYLDWISLKNCTMKSYHGGTLKHRNFTFLSFEGIMHHSIADWQNVVYDFDDNLINTLVLTSSFLLNTFLPDHFYNTLGQTGITHLSLNKNDFIEPEELIFDDPIGYSKTLPLSLRDLDFSNNNLLNFNLIMPELKYLNLENNSLGYFLESEKYSATNTTVLKDINLSFNGIDKLNTSVFHGHPCLEKINLSNNFLTDIHFDISHLKSLKIMDLSNNRIQGFEKRTIEHLNKLFDELNLQLNLSNNIIKCSCDNIQFLQWMIKRSVHFSQKNRIKCRYDNETTILLATFTKTLLQLEKECGSYTMLIILMSVALLTVCITVISGLAYRYRWTLRYIYYMTVSKYRRYKPQNIDHNFSYDAFIAYADEDKSFIVKECIPILEVQGGMEICIHQRDFLPGEEITNNITNAIHESRKTICIITRSFLDSYYCMFEFNIARMESIYSRGGTNILLLVFYDQLRAQDLPLVMLELVQQDSYLEYPDDEQGNIVFWDKIKEAIAL